MLRELYNWRQEIGTDGNDSHEGTSGLAVRGWGRRSWRTSAKWTSAYGRPQMACTL